MRIATLQLVVVLAAAVPSAARAQERPFTMPDLSGARRVGLAAALGSAHHDAGGDSASQSTIAISSLALEGGASFGPLAVSALVPLAMTSGYWDERANGVGMGNPTVDLVARRSLELGDDALVLGGGAGGSLGLASTETAAAASSLFYQDLGRFWSHGHTLRIHGDGGWARGPVFAQLQLGLDWHLGDGADASYQQTLVRLGLAAGVRPRDDVALIAELTTLSNLLDVKPTDEAEADHVAQALELGARWSREVSAGVSLFIPLEREIADSTTAALVAVAIEVAWTPGLSATR